MAGAAVRESMTVVRRPERARVARAFVEGVLGPGHPCGDDAVLLVSELFGNSVRHGGSGAPGEKVTVAVRAGDGVVRVEVTNQSGPRVPRLRPAGREAEGGLFSAAQNVHDGDIRGGHVDSGIPGIWRRVGGHGGADLVRVSRRGEQLAAVSVAGPVAGMAVPGTGGR